MKRTLLATATLAMALGLAAAPADAAVSGVGWWTRNPTASAPEGGLQVANAPDGVISYGAVRVVEDGEDIESGVLTLQESEGLNAAGAALRACPAAGTWSPGKGTMADGPKADCQAGSVALTRNEAGQWTADVTSVLDGSSPAVAVVPAEGAGVFQVSFAAPKLDVVARKSSGSGSTSSDFDTSEFTASPATSSSSSSSSSSSDSTSGASTFEPSSASSFSAASPITTDFAPAAESVAPAQDAAAALDAAAATEDDTSGSTFVARPAAAPPLGAGGNRWAQYGLFLAVAAIIGTIAGVGRNRLLGGSA